MLHKATSSSLVSEERGLIIRISCTYMGAFYLPQSLMKDQELVLEVDCDRTLGPRADLDQDVDINRQAYNAIGSPSCDLFGP